VKKPVHLINQPKDEIKLDKAGKLWKQSSWQQEWAPDWDL
jgi:hypothetical protein